MISNRKQFIITSILVLILIANNLIVKGQNNKVYLIDDVVINSSDDIDAEKFNAKAIEVILLDKINEVLAGRYKQTLKENELLKNSALDQAEYMAQLQEEKLTQTDKEKETTANRLQYYGGSKNAIEITDRNAISKGKIPYSYGKVCEDIVIRLFNSSKTAIVFENDEFDLIGVGAKLDAEKKKVYVSFVLGNYKSFNEGVGFKDKLTVPYSEKTYGITESDPVFCKRIYRMNNLNQFQQGLSVENGIIYFQTDDVSEIKKIIKKKKDGLAVDVIQKDQFSCGTPNIVDYNLINSGVLTKRVYTSKLFKNNLANTDNNRKAFKAELGYLPEGIKDKYELNLVIIQNKSACVSIPQSFVIQTNGTYSRKVELLADTVTLNAKYNYKPVADSMDLTFRIPFENKKFTYKTDDIEPFLKLLNEPAFIIYNLKIKAYSSIEGTDKENKFLQEERAKSIINALKQRQREAISTEIQTDYNWSDFKSDIQATKHNIMASMSMEEAQDYIRKYNLKKELEPLLQNHRYAEIDMKVTYDISGNNEQPYVIKKFNKAIEAEDRPLSLSIQKYVIKQIMNGRYDVAMLNNMLVPLTSAYAGMEMNRIFMLFKYGQITTEQFIEQVNKLNELNPDNEYIAFNAMLNYVNHTPLEEMINDYSLTQTKLDRLYYTPLKKSTIDALNVRLQLKIINAADSILNDEKVRSASIEKIKEIVDIKEESIGNALKLAEIFIENNDYDFARKSLEPWIDNSTGNEKVVFTYVSLCSLKESLMHTNKFTIGMQRAREINPKRYCALFNGDSFSYKVLENSEIKEEYCKYCNSDDNMVDYTDPILPAGTPIN